jgi:hypothetical protein
MSEERARQIIRQFPENGLKQVLTNPANVRELLALARAKMLPRLDFAGMQVDQTTYVTAEYRHVTSDLVLRLHLRRSGKSKSKKPLLLTILVELQSEPDRLMPLRVLEYLVQVWKQQVKQYGEKHRSLASVKLNPVLPVVLHSGSYRWERLGSLLELMEDADDFREVIPAFNPLFVSLPDVSEANLDSAGTFGQVLALLKARKARRAIFAQRLGQTVAKVEELKGDERLRRQELLCYVEALVYHSRETTEHDALRQRIDAALKNDEDRLEIDMVRRTLADVHREEGREEGRDEGRREERIAARKQTLLDQLRLRWGALPAEVEQVIEATQDADRLKEWLDRFATARTLASIGIRPPS